MQCWWSIYNYPDCEVPEVQCFITETEDLTIGILLLYGFVLHDGVALFR